MNRCVTINFCPEFIEWAVTNAMRANIEQAIGYLSSWGIESNNKGYVVISTNHRGEIVGSYFDKYQGDHTFTLAAIPDISNGNKRYTFHS